MNAEFSTLSYAAVLQAHHRYSSLQDKSTDEANTLEQTLSGWDKRKRKFDAFLEQRGRRYAPCTFDDFDTTSSDQLKVVNELREYGEHARERIQSGQNVLMIGPKGTGKDHLLVALSKVVFMQLGISPNWHNGVELLELFHREAKDPPERNRDPLVENPVLYVSDLVPPSGGLSESNRKSLFRVIDGRYASMRPTWLSLNVVSKNDASDKLGAQVVDRLAQDALILFCNWESYRIGS